MENYLYFWGHNQKEKDIIDKSCLSQWYPSSFLENGRTFLTCEHYMMFKKAQLFKDLNSMKLILELTTPKEAKAQGRKVRGFNAAIWDKVKLSIVIKGNLLKFEQNDNLKKFLLSHRGKEFVEASPYDKIWGIGMSESQAKKVGKSNWKGENLLGIALNKVSEMLIEKEGFLS